MKRLRWVLILATILLPTTLAVACPMCKDSIANSDADQASSLPAGFNYSVYYMLSGLFLTLGFAGTAIVKGVRNTNDRMKLPPDQSK